MIKTDIRKMRRDEGTGKTRNKEMQMGNGKREMKKMGITACPLCILQHQFWSGLLPQLRGNRDYIAYASA